MGVDVAGESGDGKEARVDTLLGTAVGTSWSLKSPERRWVFKMPVDVVRLNLPDYFDRIKCPMDLGSATSPPLTSRGALVLWCFVLNPHRRPPNSKFLF